MFTISSLISGSHSELNSIKSSRMQGLPLELSQRFHVYSYRLSFKMLPVTPRTSSFVYVFAWHRHWVYGLFWKTLSYTSIYGGWRLKEWENLQIYNHNKIFFHKINFGCEELLYFSISSCSCYTSQKEHSRRNTDLNPLKRLHFHLYHTQLQYVKPNSVSAP